jgi:hypothetical protein
MNENQILIIIAILLVVISIDFFEMNTDTLRLAHNARSE